MRNIRNALTFTALLYIVLNSCYAQNFETGDNSTVKGCS